MRRVGLRGLWLLLPLGAILMPTVAWAATGTGTPTCAVTNPFAAGAPGYATFHQQLNQLPWTQQILVDFFTFILGSLLSIAGLQDTGQLVFDQGCQPFGAYGAWPSGWWVHVLSPVVTAMQAISLLIATAILAVAALQYFLNASTNPRARMAWTTMLWHFLGAAGSVALFPVLLRWLLALNHAAVELFGSLTGGVPSLLSLLPAPSTGFWGWFVIELILVGTTLWINLFFMFRALTLAILVVLGPIIGGITLLHPQWTGVYAQYWRELTLDIFQQSFAAAVMMVFLRVERLAPHRSWILVAAFALILPTLITTLRGLFGASAVGGRSGMMAMMGAGAALGALDLAHQASRVIRGGSGGRASSTGAADRGVATGLNATPSLMHDPALTERVRNRAHQDTGSPLSLSQRRGAAVERARRLGGGLGHASGALAMGLIGAGAAGLVGADIGARIGGAAGTRVGRGTVGGLTASGLLGREVVGAVGDAARYRARTAAPAAAAPAHFVDAAAENGAPEARAEMMDLGPNPIDLPYNLAGPSDTPGDGAGWDARTNPAGRPAPTTFSGFLGQRLIGSASAGPHAPTAGLTASEGRLAAWREGVGFLGAGIAGAAGGRAAAGLASAAARMSGRPPSYGMAPDQAFAQVQEGDTVAVVQHATHQELWHTHAGLSRRIGVDTARGDARVQPGAPHYQDFTVVAAGSPLAMRREAIPLDATRVLVPQGNASVQHADLRLSTDLDHMVFTHRQ